MKRNLVVCCDGTGNLWRAGPNKTNVAKLVDALVQSPEEQVLYYDPGVGTPDGYVTDSTGTSIRDRVRRIKGLASGAGAWENVAEAYRFVVNHHGRVPDPHDRIFLFGFSRGAFTARAVSGLLHLFGILRPEHDNLIPTLLSVYRSKPDDARRDTAEEIKRRFAREVDGLKIHFVGVWETVESVGLGQLVLGTRITSDHRVKESFSHVRHALALDELRWPFEPRLYDEPAAAWLTPDRSFKQVWFAGAHSDVGGGYDHAGLSHAALHWMVREANACGLLVRFERLEQHLVDYGDRAHDESLSTPWWTFGAVFSRHGEARPGVIHESVEERRRAPGSRYAPPIATDVTVEHTRAEVIEEGHAVQRPVPTAAGRGTANGVPEFGKANTIWLLIAGIVAAAMYAWGWPASATVAAIQLTQSWSGDLGAALLRTVGDGDALAPRKVLQRDLMFVVSYVVLLPVLVRAAQHFQSPHGHPRRFTGRALSASIIVLPVADVSENLLSLGALEVAGTTLGSPWAWSFAAGIASVGKAVALLVLAGGLASCLLEGGAARLRHIGRRN